MKNIALVSLVVLSLFTGCKSSREDPAAGFSAQIRNIVPESIIQNLKDRGMPVYEGTAPPKVEGIYVSSPHELFSPYDGDSYSKGYKFNDLKIKFSEQNDKDLSIRADLKGSTTGTGIGAFLSGHGNFFTLFAEIKATDGVVTSTQIRVFSGEWTDTGIKNLYTALIMKDKNDPGETLIPVGQGRILRDSDGLASNSSSFRLATGEEKPSDASNKK
ncbi:hypothetical protein [Siphonobacter aquaeclarae]|uniref:Lipoprotein n=1 Tax=Siphonobacter aquaeclarae TaxID=563176 RepID=A0A1G9VHV6_9BACT|nr:hypothetical protein [Siphonobacter aquaeclarae]MBO9636725.1 hypothetical protein [Siphonobacter aquaeclarae]SDM71657.1 hypothetical protein SAMN04488090_4115 [Siphonobacter aquaeclarae]